MRRLIRALRGYLFMNRTWRCAWAMAERRA